MYSRSRSPRALEDSSRLRKLRPFQGVLLLGGVGVQEPGTSSHPSLGHCLFSALLLSMALLTSLAWAGGTQKKRGGSPGERSRARLLVGSVTLEPRHSLLQSIYSCQRAELPKGFSSDYADGP